MQIIILTPGFPVDENDTTCIPALQDFVLGWKEFIDSTGENIQLRIISFQYPHHQKKYKWYGIPVFAAGGKDRKGLNRLLTWRRVWNEMKGTVVQGQTILLSYFLTEASLVAQRFSRHYKIPHISMAAGQDVRIQNGFLGKLDLKKLIIVAFNQKMSDELNLSCRRNADYIIPMGSAGNANHLPGMKFRDIDVLIVGSLISVKRTEIAIQLVAGLKKEFHGLCAEIIGDGPQRKNLGELVTHLDLKDHLHFSGKLPREEVISKMSRSKILLHTSAYEGQATVITEALANGMTVVCFDIGRISDHEKIKVCNTENEMMNVLKMLLRKNEFDFTPVVPFLMRDTIGEYWKVILSKMENEK